MEMRHVIRIARPCLLAMALACTTTPDPPAAGHSRAWGYVRLIPHAGVEADSGGGSYGDRRVRNAVLVDYSHPGFAVVYAERPAAEGGVAELAIRTTATGSRFEPRHAAIGTGGRLRVLNGDSRKRVLSVPALNLLRAMAPGEAIEVGVPQAGPLHLYLPDEPATEALVFVAPGPFAVTSDAGRFSLPDLEPGRVRLAAWHPRFPPVARWFELRPDAVVRIDLEIGVGLEDQESDATP